MPDWPGTAAKPVWPGAPAAPVQEAAPAAQWPGTPGRIDVFKGATPPTQAAPSSWPGTPAAPEDEEDHGYFAETSKQFTEGVGRIKAAGDRASKQPIEGILQTGGAIAGAAQAAASPLTGAVRSFGGRALQGLDKAVRAGGVAMYGEDRVPKGETFEQSASQAEKIGMIAPLVGMAPRNPGAGIAAARKATAFIEKIFSPETVDADAKNAVALIRETTGKATRDTAQTAAGLESSYKKVNSMPDADRLDFLDYVEGRSTGAQLSDPSLQGLADTMKSAFEKRMNKLQALPEHQQANFIEDYFPHFWKDPNAARQFAQSYGGGVGKQGSGASLKKRTMPTIADGIAAGLDPLTTNPLEATMRYVTSMDKFIAQQEVFEISENAGHIKFIKPKTMGASGHPDSFRVPDGWVPLKGRGAQRMDGAKAYAPEGFATIYNNYISRGFEGAGGEAYDAARLATNTVTGLELSLSGYHFLTMTKAALDNSLAQAIQLLRSGKPIEAVKQAARTPLAPYRYYKSGKEVKDVYLGNAPGSQALQDTVEKLTAAGGRAVGKEHAPEYEFSKSGSYVTAIKRGALKIQFAADRAEARGANIRTFGEARFAAKQIGRIMDTVAAPLFEHYIPNIKNGAFRENLATWLKVHPNATQDEQLNAARQIWDTVDDRFGEMVQDNIFMNKLTKQVGMLMLRSWSWTVGQDVRMMGGAARDVARAPFKTVTGIGPNEGRWTQKMDMAIAAPIVYGTIAAIYQALKTGEAPKDIHDLMAPRTGGTDATTGQPERLLLPGPEKDVYGVLNKGFTEEAGGKLSTVPRMASEMWTNKDFRGDPILPTGQEGQPPWLQEFAKYLGSQTIPFSVKQLYKSNKTGSNLNALETALGVRPAPRYLTDPEGYEQMMEGIHGKQWRDKVRHDRKQEGLYGNE